MIMIIIIIMIIIKLFPDSVVGSSHKLSLHLRHEYNANVTPSDTQQVPLKGFPLNDNHIDKLPLHRKYADPNPRQKDSSTHEHKTRKSAHNDTKHQRLKNGMHFNSSDGHSVKNIKLLRDSNNKYDATGEAGKSVSLFIRTSKFRRSRKHFRGSLNASLWRLHRLGKRNFERPTGHHGTLVNNSIRLHSREHIRNKTKDFKRTRDNKRERRKKRRTKRDVALSSSQSIDQFERVDTFKESNVVDRERLHSKTTLPHAKTKKTSTVIANSFEDSSLMLGSSIPNKHMTSAANGKASPPCTNSDLRGSHISRSKPHTASQSMSALFPCSERVKKQKRKLRKPESGFRKGRLHRHKRHSRLSRRNAILKGFKLKPSKVRRTTDGLKTNALQPMKKYEVPSNRNSERLLHRYKRKLEVEEPSPPSRHFPKQHKKSKRRRRRQTGYMKKRVLLQRGKAYWPVRALARSDPRALRNLMITPRRTGFNQETNGLVENTQLKSKKMLVPRFYGYPPRTNVYSRLDPWPLANERQAFPIREPVFWQRTQQQIPSYAFGEVQRAVLGGARPVLNSPSLRTSVAPQFVTAEAWKPADGRSMPSWLQQTGVRHTPLRGSTQTVRHSYGDFNIEAFPQEGSLRHEVPTMKNALTSDVGFAKAVARQEILQKKKMAPNALKQIALTQTTVPLRYGALYPQSLAQGRSNINRAGSSQAESTEKSKLRRELFSHKQTLKMIE